jgi:hypothetical protein
MWSAAWRTLAVADLAPARAERQLVEAPERQVDEQRD